MKFNFQPHLFYLAAASTMANAQNTSVNNTSQIQLKPPIDADGAIAVDQGFVGFGIETKSFPQYAGRDEPNTFSNNLLSAISDRTGAPVHVRVGGTSMDNSVFDSSQGDDAVKNTTDSSVCRLHTNITLGLPWVSSFKNLNSSTTRYIFQIPLARRNVSNGIEFARACINHFPSKIQQLDAIEIGNEPNFYTSAPKASCKPHDRRDWWPSDYATEWIGYAENITENVDSLQETKEWFQAMTFASNINQTEWSVKGVWNDGIEDGGYVKTVSQHYYQAVSTDHDLQHALMNHSVTVSTMESKFRPGISFLKAKGTPFILGEVGSAIGGSNGDPNPDLYGSLGAALWTADFMLYGMSIGIHRVSMQLGTNFNIASWQPVNTTKANKGVRGNFYGHVFAAEFIGSAGKLQIRNLSTDGHPHIVGYAGYNDGKLSKLAVLNLQLWNRSDDSRPAKYISLPHLEDSITKAKVSRLTAPHGGTAHDGITWAGKRWTAENNGVPEQVSEGPVTVDVKNGSLSGNVTVWASEAVLIELLSS